MQSLGGGGEQTKSIVVFFEVAYTDFCDGQCEPLFKEVRPRDSTVA